MKHKHLNLTAMHNISANVWFADVSANVLLARYAISSKFPLEGQGLKYSVEMLITYIYICNDGPGCINLL